MEREKQWKSAKELFVALVLKEAPIKLGRERLVAPYITKLDAAIGGTLKELDSTEDYFEKSFYKKETPVDDLEKALGKYSTASNGLNSSVKTLLANLQQSIDKFKTEEAPGQPKMKENLVRGLKVLKTSLDALAKSNDTWLAGAKIKLDGKGKTLDTFESMAKTFIVTLQSSVARGLAAAQRIKAAPKPDIYNKEFPKAARDITQQVGNVAKLAGKGFEVPGPKDTTALFNALKPFADGELAKIDGAKPPAEVLVLVSQFNKAVKAVADAYGLH